ncbi:Uncharacterised protein [Vibrio cholerae]|nr:Uncharacterised protein [Vibrio cholerae]
MHFVSETIREQRTNWTVNQTSNQRFAFRRTAFALKETARDFTCRVSTLLVVYSQREEILTHYRFFLTDHRDKHRSVIHGSHYCCRCLASHYTRFESNGVVTVLKRFYYWFFEHEYSLFSGQA